MNYIRMHRRTIGIAAGVLAIAAIAAPVASARPNLEPLPTVHVSATTAHATVVKPNPDQQAPQTAQTATGVPPGLSRSQASEIAAIDRAKASEPGQPRAAEGALQHRGPDHGSHPACGTATLKAPGNGFDWGDAAVGAGVAAAIGLLIAAASVAVRRRSRTASSVATGMQAIEGGRPSPALTPARGGELEVAYVAIGGGAALLPLIVCAIRAIGRRLGSGGSRGRARA